MNVLPMDYEERVYAGVLGKIIGVYLGRPFEGWTNKRIESELGEIYYYVHEKLNAPLIVADDDISGTFTFLRALPDCGMCHDITPEQIGNTWLNYLIEKRTVLWWGGMGTSTEHTAFLRLKNGIAAPQSGSMERNGKTVAEQIGAQIFIDGWAMVCPGDPEKAAALAAKAASVSHDGEAIWGAQVLASMQAQAFVEPDIMTLLTTATQFIPRASTIYAVIQDVCQWKAEYLHNWRAAFGEIEAKYGYDKFGGGCHIIPNHAIILLSLLYGDDDFQKTLMIASTAGWDTDCNAGNVGALMGIKNGLAGLDRGADFRTPVADRLVLPTADGGRCITDAVRETYEIVNIARSLQNQRPVHPSHGMRFHFNLPGSVQGFMPDDAPEARNVLQIENVGTPEGDDVSARDERMLALHYTGVAPGRIARAGTPTFLPPDMLRSTVYGLAAAPTLYPGQTVRARLLADVNNLYAAPVSLYVRVYGKNDVLEILRSDPKVFAPGEDSHFHWDVPDTHGKVVAEVGVQVGGNAGSGVVYLDWMGWGGPPTALFERPADNEKGTAWKRSWVNALDELRDGPENAPFGCVQNEGTGLCYTGETGWCGYQISTTAHVHLADDFGLIVNVRGLRRYAALVLSWDKMARLVAFHDGQETVLAETPCAWEMYQDLPLTVAAQRDGTIMAVCGKEGDAAYATLTGYVDAARAQGAAGFRVSEGRVSFGPMQIEIAPELLIG